MMGMALLLLSAVSSAAASPAPPPPFVGPCSFIEEDCNGEDYIKIDGNGSHPMTQEICCTLCKIHGDKCKVAVVATGWKSVGQCLLKTGCSRPVAATHRVKCCLPGAAGKAGCAGKPGPPPPPACNKEALPTFCDHTKHIDARVAELVAKMTADEKVGQVGSNGVPGIERLGIPPYQWWGEAQHGVCQSPSVQFRPPTPYGTSFPEPGLTAATFDKELFSTIGDVIGSEGRAMANAGNAGLTFWAPNINIVR
eukprot:SAG11_NODE_4015_length_2106_cov_3.022422_1_plen_252_part_00